MKSSTVHTENIHVGSLVTILICIDANADGDTQVLMLMQVLILMRALMLIDADLLPEEGRGHNFHSTDQYRD